MSTPSSTSTQEGKPPDPQNKFDSEQLSDPFEPDQPQPETPTTPEGKKSKIKTTTIRENVDLKTLCHRPELLQNLLESGMSPNCEVDSQLGIKLIHQAVIDNHVHIIPLLVKYKVNINAIDNMGLTAINYSLQKENIDSLRMLLQHGADPNKSIIRQDSTLHVAASIQDPMFCKLLLQYNAKAEHPDFYGDWPLHKALLEDYNETACVLINHPTTKFQVNKQGARNFTPLHIAASEGDFDAIEMLIEANARLDYKNIRGRTPIDMLINKEDTYALELIGRNLVKHVLAEDEELPLDELLKKEEVHDYFKKLKTIDNEYQHDFGQYNSETVPNQDEDDNENLILIQSIERDDRIDLNEFINICVKAAKKGLADEIIAAGLVGKIADNVLRHIFLPQSEVLLLEVMACGLLWSKIIDYLEINYVYVYQKSLTTKKDGIKGLILRTCTNNKGKVSAEKLHKLVAKLTKMWQLQCSEEWEDNDSNDSDSTKSDSKLEDDKKLNKRNNRRSISIKSSDQSTGKCVMKNPIASIALWCILTGRLKLVLYFLKQEDHDLIPLALLIATILRALGCRRDIEDVYAEKACKMADKCEGVAIQALRRVKEFDSSPNNILTMEYVRLPLCGYGNYTLLDLAARGGSSKFVTIDVVQAALDLEWFKDFSFVQGRFVSEITIAMGFIPPLMPFVPMMMRKCRAHFPDFINKEDEPKSKKEEHNKTPKPSSSSDTEELLPLVAIKQPNNNLSKSSNEEDPKIPPCENKNSESQIHHYFRDMYKFYQTPCVKFRVHVTCHVTFIMILSYNVISDFRAYISPYEYLTYITLLGFFLEEISEMINCHKEESVAEYFTDGWNLIDLVAILCGFVAFIMRLELTLGVYNEEIWYWSLVLLSTTCLVYWIRLLYVSVVLESLGPKLKMMSLMIKKDFLPFLYILFVLMFGFGVTIQSLLYPNGRSPQDNAPKLSVGEIFIYMFRTTFYVMVGDYETKPPCAPHVNATTSDDGNELNCVHPLGKRLVTNIYLVLYIVISQILLLNLIVAMFSKTIDEIDSVSKAMWQFEKFDLIEEFQVRSALPPPFNTLSEIRNFIFWLIRKVTKKEVSIMPSALNYKKDAKIFLLFHFYQALALRQTRAKLTGVVQDEEDLDEAAKILNNGINEIKEKMEKVERLEETVKKLESLIKSFEVKERNKGRTSNLKPSRRSIQTMSFMDEEETATAPKTATKDAPVK